MTYISVCSGIEACSVAWEPLGWKPLLFAEIEKFPSAVLKHHYPDIENKGDITQYAEWEQCPVDLVVGGTPCQSFSIAGQRDGTDDIRGHLIYSYLGIVGKYKPTWVLWENVPGVLSSNSGLDFASFLSGLEECGYGWCYRVLDAQYFGVPQRRRRVFVVGHIGGRADLATKVLFESESVFRDFTAGKGKKQANTTGTKNSTKTTVYDCGGFSRVKKCEGITQTVLANYSKMNDNGTFVLEQTLFAKGSGSIPVVFENHPGDSRIKELGDKCSTVNARWGTGGNNIPLVLNNPISIQGNIIGRSDKAGACGKGFNKNVMYTLTSTDVHAVCNRGTVRRITPLETERLQGFPDNWTQIPWNGKQAEYCPDSLRYKAIGNSMAVDVMRWIGKRIEAVDKGQIYG